MKTAIYKWASLALLSLLTACATGPSKADVEADRARWTAMRDVTADSTIDASESPLVDELLVEWDNKLAADEKAAGAERDGRTIAADLLRAYGLAAVQVFLEPELKARAPELYRLIDKDSSGWLSAEEIMSVDPTSPVFAVVVTTTAMHLLRKR
jgi:hypothetical protein